MIPAPHARRVCWALKLWSLEPKSHGLALVADEGLACLDKLQIPFITRRRRSPKRLPEIVLLPRSDAVRFFHWDALSSAVGLKVDFDMARLALASGLYRLMVQRMRGYADA